MADSADTSTGKRRIFVEQRLNREEDSDNLSGIFHLMHSLSTDFSEMRTLLTIHMKDFEKHISNEEAQRVEVTTELKKLNLRIEAASKLKEAFPHVNDEPDLYGHRTDHESRMEDADNSHKFWEKIKDEAISKVVSAVVIACVVIFGLGLKDYLNEYLGHTTPATTAAIHQAIGEHK